MSVLHLLATADPQRVALCAGATSRGDSLVVTDSGAATLRDDALLLALRDCEAAIFWLQADEAPEFRGPESITSIDAAGLVALACECESSITWSQIP